jgi:hypothetical protein
VGTKCGLLAVPLVVLAMVATAGTATHILAWDDWIGTMIGMEDMDGWSIMDAAIKTMFTTT